MTEDEIKEEPDMESQSLNSPADTEGRKDYQTFSSSDN